MSDIKIVDCIMGAGKTSAAINYIINSPEDIRFIFVTPFVKESETICKKINGREFFLPTGDCKGRKASSAIHKGMDIICTHELFRRFSFETLDMLKEKQYTLIIDEEIDVVSVKVIPEEIMSVIFGQCNYHGKDMSVASVENGTVTINNPTAFNTLFKDYLDMNASDSIELYAGNTMVRLLNRRYFDSFERVFVLTYLFNGSVLKCYFDKMKMSYSFLDVDKSGGEFTLVDYKVKRDKKNYLSHIRLVETEKQNEVGNGKFSLSKSSLDRDIKNCGSVISQIKKNMVAILKRNKIKSSDIIWTTYKTFQKDISGAGYSKKECFLPINARATNEYSDKHFVAFLANVFPNTGVYNFFKQDGITIDVDNYALSCLVQFVWRSAIRKQIPEDIVLYIPSERMRNLFTNWLNTI